MPGSSSELGSYAVPPQPLSSWQILVARCCPIAKLVSPAHSLQPVQAWNDSLGKELVCASPSVDVASPAVKWKCRYPAKWMSWPSIEMKAVSLSSLIILLASAWRAQSTALCCFLLFLTPFRGCVVSREQKAPSPYGCRSACPIQQLHRGKKRCILHLALYLCLHEAAGVHPSLILMECWHERGQKDKGRTII